MFIDVAQGMRQPPLRYSPFKALVVPRPIGWISTLDKEGGVNLAPFSYFNAVSDAPPMVMYCANGSHHQGGAKDSRLNAEATGEFVVNLATWELRAQMNQSSANMPRSQDEMAAAGLTPAESHFVRPPRVAAAPAHLECRYWQTIRLPSTIDGVENAMILGEVVGIHIADAMIQDGRVDVARMRPIARLGYQDYTSVDQLFSLQRPG